MTPDEFRDYVAATQTCGDHPLPQLTPEVLASVVRVADVFLDEGAFWEHTGYILVELAHGQAGVFSEWSDTSGHG